jgi:hypothetical protein
MASKLDQLTDKLDQAFKHTPGFKEWMAMQTRIAARDASVRLDIWNEWNDRRQEQPEAQTQPEPPGPEIIRGLRNRETPIREQAYILTVLWNEAAGDGPLIEPWDDLDERDERAELLCFRRESCDLNGDHFGLDPNPYSSRRKLWSPSPFRPCHLDELMSFVDQCLAFFHAQGEENPEPSFFDWNASPSEVERGDRSENGKSSVPHGDEPTSPQLIVNQTNIVSVQLPADPPSSPTAVGTDRAANLSEAKADNTPLPLEATHLAIAKDKCQPAEVKAWLIEQYAIQKNGSFKNLPATFAWLEDHFEPDGEDVPTGLRGYELPNRETWSRQVRAVRKATGTNVNAPRAWRSHGSSIVKEVEI